MGTEAVGGPGRAQGLGVMAGSLVAAVLTLVVQVITAHSLTVADNSRFLAFWSLLFFGYAVAAGAQNEITRSVRESTLRPDPYPRGPRLTAVAGALGLALAACAALASALAGTSLLYAQATGVSLALTLGMFAAVGAAATGGGLSGEGKWGWFALHLGAEPVLRLALFTLAAATAATLGSFEAAAAAGGFAWLALALLHRPVRDTWRARMDATAPLVTGRLLKAMAGAGASGLLVVAFPTLLNLSVPRQDYLGAAPLLLAISLTRAPLLIPLTAFQGAVIAAVVNNPRGAPRRVLGAAGAIMALAAGAAGAAYLAGPWLMEVIFGPRYRLPGALLAALTLAAGLLAVLMLAGATTLALKAHGANAAAWLTAIAVAWACLRFLPLPLGASASVALLLGPCAGLALQVGAVIRRLRYRQEV